MNSKIIALCLCCCAVTMAGSAANVICPTPVDPKEANSCQIAITSSLQLVGCIVFPLATLSCIMA